MNAMPEVSRASWNAEDWENYCIRILRLRHSHALIPVPDSSGGDAGLEAFTHAGIAWQCYAPENEPLAPKARYALQRDKITKDLGKLQKNEQRLLQILGAGTVLHRWILMTPNHESSDLIAHCNDKALTVRGWGLPFIADDFMVSVETLDDYELEHRASQRAGSLPGGLSLGPEELPAFDAGTAYADAWSERIAVMDEKLARILPDPGLRAFYRGELLSRRVVGDDRMDMFRQRVPEVAAALFVETQTAKRSMLMNQSVNVDVDNQGLVNVRKDLERRLTSVAQDVSPSTIEAIAEAAITAWLEECSMNFRDTGQV